METQEREPIQTCSIGELQTRLAQHNSNILDVREYPEYAEGHLEGSRLLPLGELRRNPSLAGAGGEVYLLCQTGRRAREAAALLQEAGACTPVVVEGGIAAWKQAGHPVHRRKGPIALERQVRIAAGSLVLLGLLVPGLRWLPYFVGAGLIFAGVTNSCAMGMLLARLPWNRPRFQPASCAR
jgi:rhodanese-related sulfurtransferase